MSDDVRRVRRLPGLRRERPTPRVEELDALLRQVDDLRLTLETDLSLAASALEAGAPELALDVLDADRAEVADFEVRALEQLDQLSLRRRRSWVPTHAASIAVAAGLVGLLAGVVPQALAPQQPSTSTVSSDAAANLELLQDLAADGDASEIRAVSAALHAQLAAVVAHAKTDPVAAQTALLMLSYEQHALVSSGDVAALGDVLRQSQALARRIRAALPASLKTAVPQPEVPAADVPESRPTTTASPKPSATASAKPSPTASPKPSPTATPSPTSSPKDDGYPLPKFEP